MQRIEYEGNLNEPQGLVLAPTRELAQQIQKVIIVLGDYLDVSWESVIWCKMVDYSSNPVLCNDVQLLVINWYLDYMF